MNTGKVVLFIWCVVGSLTSVANYHKYLCDMHLYGLH